MLSPLVATGWVILNTGSSLAHAYVRTGFSDGTWLRAKLNRTGWEVDQVITLREAQSVVPEPVSMAPLGTGLAGVAVIRRRPKGKGEKA